MEEDPGRKALFIWLVWEKWSQGLSPAFQLVSRSPSCAGREVLLRYKSHYYQLDLVPEPAVEVQEVQELQEEQEDQGEAGLIGKVLYFMSSFVESLDWTFCIGKRKCLVK